MDKKSLIVLSVILAVLVGLVFLKENFKPEVATTEEIADIITPALSKDNLTQMTLRIGDGEAGDSEEPQKVLLVNKEGTWTVATQYGIRANESTMDSLLEKLDQLQGELRSNKKSLLADYGIDDETGVHLELKQAGGKDIHLLVGTKKAGFSNNFVRLADSNAVYVVGENLLGAVGVWGEGEDQKMDEQKWADKRVAHLQANDVVGFAVTQVQEENEQTVLDIRKKTVDGQMKWQSVEPQPFTLSASKIKSMLERFNSTYAREVVGPDMEGVFDAPGWTGTFTMQDGSQVRIVRGSKDDEEKNYYVKQEGAAYAFLVPVATFDSREKRLGDIFAENPLDIDKEDVQGIDIREIETKDMFVAVKGVAAEAGQPSGEDDQEEPAHKENKSVWRTPDGEDVEESKLENVINKLKAIKTEIVPAGASAANAMTVRITRDGQADEFTLSEEVTLSNGKECVLLGVDGYDRDYCVAKSQYDALRNALP